MTTWAWILLIVLIVLFLALLFSSSPSVVVSRDLPSQGTTSFYVDEEDKKIVLVRANGSAETITGDLPVSALRQGDYLAVEVPLYGDKEKTKVIGQGIHNSFIYETGNDSTRRFYTVGANNFSEGTIFVQMSGIMTNSMRNYKGDVSVTGGSGKYAQAKGNSTHKPENGNILEVISHY